MRGSPLAHSRPTRLSRADTTMTRSPTTLVVAAAAMLALLLFLIASAPRAQQALPQFEFNDSHFHLTNYIQEGIPIQKFLQIMGTRVGRSALFGIPLQQEWAYGNSGAFAPTY